MRDFLFDELKGNKADASILGRFGKKGLSKSDLDFLVKSDFYLLDRAHLISGVLVGYHPVVPNGMFPQRWDLRTCYNSPKDLSYISKLITNHGNSFNSLYEYFVMDSAGNMLSANLKVSSETDEQGVIHLTTDDESLDQFVYPAILKKCSYKCFYCYNEQIEKLDKQVQSYADQKLIVRPTEFKSEPSSAPKTEDRCQ